MRDGAPYAKKKMILMTTSIRFHVSLFNQHKSSERTNEHVYDVREK